MYHMHHMVLIEPSYQNKYRLIMLKYNFRFFIILGKHKYYDTDVVQIK